MHYLIYKGESVCVCVSGIEIHTVGPILTKFGMGGLTLQAPGHRLCFGPQGGPSGSGGPKQGLESIYSLNHETKQKVYRNKSCREAKLACQEVKIENIPIQPNIL